MKLIQNHDQMNVDEHGITTVVKADLNQVLQTAKKPVFSFEYDTLTFSTSLKQYKLAGRVYSISEAMAVEILDYLATVEEDKAITQMIRTNKQNLDYLNATDWYAIREAETGTPMPEDIRIKRAEARSAIKELPQ